MRVTIAATSATGQQESITKIFESLRKCNVKLQVLDPVTLYVSRERSDLSTLDQAGNPKRGLALGQGVYDFLAFTGELWGACNQQIEVEVQRWLL